MKYVEILEHPALSTDFERGLIGVKGRVLAKYVASGRSRLLLTDGREVVMPDVALRPIPKKSF